MVTSVAHREYRMHVADRLMELGNLVAVSLVFGQLLIKEKFSMEVFLLGSFVTILCYIISYLITR